MDISSVIFFLLSALIIFFAVAVLFFPNPIHASLSLAGMMVSLGFLYFNLGAYFIAAVQLIVYAGAVMVLFIMVLMLFDLQKEEHSFAGNPVSVAMKVLSGVAISALITTAIASSIKGSDYEKIAEATPIEQMASVKLLASQLFTKYVFAFEVLGVLLLLIAIGVVAVSRAKGGTHVRH